MENLYKIALTNMEVNELKGLIEKRIEGLELEKLESLGYTRDPLTEASIKVANQEVKDFFRNMLDKLDTVVWKV